MFLSIVLLISVLWVNTHSDQCILVMSLCTVTEDAELSVYHSAVVSASIHTMPGKESLQLLKVWISICKIDIAKITFSISIIRET